MNRTPAHAFLDSIEPYDLYEIGALIESNPRLARVADPMGFLPLHKAAWAGDEGLAGRLLDLGARADARDAGGNTPLHLAAFRGWMGVTRLLLARGADGDARDGDNRTALFAAAFDGNEAVGLLLLSHEANVGEPEGSRILRAAAGNGMAGLVEAMLDAGADPSARDGDGRTPLEVAVQRGHARAADVLRRGG